MDRRGFLTLAGGGAATLALADALAPAAALAADGRRARAAARATRVPPGPFTLGVASGDPLPDGVVLWTRLAPTPLDPGGGMPDAPVPVAYEVAADERFRRIVRRGSALARPAGAHTVHADVRGLRPGATYWYRFRAGGELSPTGRARTAPAAGARVRRARFATASCQNYQDGYYTAHQALAGEDLDFVVFLGDYIYEGRPNPAALRSHDGVAEPLTLDEYRSRHALYRSDPDLQAAHAAFPWVVTLDDHEVDNNWADDIPQDPGLQSPEAFRARRIAAFQAYWEHMPLRRAQAPRGPDMTLYRRLGWGDLLQLDVLDTRQYRSDQPTSLAGAEDPASTMLGAEQEAWLDRGLAGSSARWNALAQPRCSTSTTGTVTGPPAGASSTRSTGCGTRSCSRATGTPPGSATCGATSATRRRRWWAPSSPARRSPPVATRTWSPSTPSTTRSWPRARTGSSSTTSAV